MKAKLLTPSIEPSPRPGWDASGDASGDASVEVVAAEISPSMRQQRSLRKACLERDQNRCVVSGYYDYQKLEKLPEGHPIKESEDGITTQTAHVVPFCYGSFEKSGVSALSQIQSLANLIVNKEKKTGPTWEALWRAFPSMHSRVLLFGPEQINEPYNALTLGSNIHAAFGSFSIAFESTVSILSKCSASI